MRESIEIVKKFDETLMLPIPGFGDEVDTRALCAMHIEKNVLAKDMEDFYKGVREILTKFNRDVSMSEKYIEIMSSYSELLEKIISKLYNSGKELASKGRFFYPKEDYVYKDDTRGVWGINLKALQKEEAKYDGVNLFSGRVIIKFNPIRKNDNILVDNTGMEIREGAEADVHAIREMVQKYIGVPASKDPDEDKKIVDYSSWDELIHSCKDRDIVLIFKDGDEIKRF